MFLELSSNGSKHKGWIEVITGSMFSGKTEELIRRINRIKIANQKLKVFKPSVDDRYAKDLVVSHDEKCVDSIIVNKSKDILAQIKDENVVFIDEAQFFDMGLTNVCNKLANMGKRIIVAGLDMDYTGEPFGPLPQLLAIAEYVTKLHAICTKCGELAQYSFRLVPGKEKIVLGEKKEYTPLCRTCFNLAIKN